MAAITISKAMWIAAGHTLLYVGVLYLRKASRPSPTQNREYPSVIKARMSAVTVACLFSIFGNRYIIEQARKSGQRTGIEEWDEILDGWGEWELDIKKTIHALALTMLLFLGPLVERFWIFKEGRDIYGGLKNGLTSLIGWRNYIFGPASEEIVFRGCIIPLFLMAGVRPLTIIFTTPLFFGGAHVHHAYEHHLHHSYPLGIILISSLVQFTYTTLFGWYASYIFLSTQTIWAPIVVHAFCNIMGLPRFFGQIPGVPLWKTYVYYLCLVLGATGFGVGVGSIKPADLHL